ncbi:hypothetical protein BDV26DRAFT_302457 [Aspergillus bertholletiae]|uniref:AMP-dependent synthetase/ligase domain-containing protein n=1 Tax=Aspergillus bertholletiae TaxID=1226010 RepID=A0A5N7AQ15_9EURO|nr:hypothetical protein BDV26DRAFT_302457 [Aspergillus bertholletiae]
MHPDYYSVSDVLAVARLHPFYSSTTYPPTREELPHILAKSKGLATDLELASFPLTWKSELYKQITRLTVDLDPRNGYRRSTYISTTGGGSGRGPPMIFATDSVENHQQRVVLGSMLKICGILEPGDWVLTMHNAGHLYRALDLMTEVFESAGAAVLCAGPDMDHKDVIDTIAEYQVNVISGDAGQLVQLAKSIATLPDEQRMSLRVNKLLYTSEAITPAQRSFLASVFGPIALSSVIGSAEAGPWGVSSAEMTVGAADRNYTDFIFDQRLIHLEVFPLSIEELNEGERNQHGHNIEPLSEGEKGLLIQTSLQRLRNPLVRYVCGDVASLHPLPETVQRKLPQETSHHYKVVRIYGRDRRISFDWYGEYFEFQVVQALMRTESWGVLQYQIILRNKEEDVSGVATVLEVRILRGTGNGQISEPELTREIRNFFMVFDFNEELFQLTFLSNYSGFVRSTTGRKVINFVNWTGKN